MTVEEVKPEGTSVMVSNTVEALVEKPGFMDSLGKFIKASADEIAVLFALVSYAAMIFMGKTIPIEYTGMAIMLVTDYVKKEWST